MCGNFVHSLQWDANGLPATRTRSRSSFDYHSLDIQDRKRKDSRSGTRCDWVIRGWWWRSEWHRKWHEGKRKTEIFIPDSEPCLIRLFARPLLFIGCSFHFSPNFQSQFSRACALRSASLVNLIDSISILIRRFSPTRETLNSQAFGEKKFIYRATWSLVPSTPMAIWLEEGTTSASWLLL